MLIELSKRKLISKESVGLPMNGLQIRSCGPYFRSFLPHSYGYEPANKLKSVPEASNFRFGSYSPTDSKMQ